MKQNSIANPLGKIALTDNIDIELLSDSEGMTVGRILFNAPEAAPLHHHPHEEVNVVVAGCFEVQIGDEQYRVKVGDTVRVAPHLPHSIRALDNGGEILTSWTPSRRDLVAKVLG